MLVEIVREGSSGYPETGLYLTLSNYRVVSLHTFFPNGEFFA
jgi:hypothetical protein